MSNNPEESARRQIILVPPPRTNTSSFLENILSEDLILIVMESNHILLQRYRYVLLNLFGLAWGCGAKAKGETLSSGTDNRQRKPSCRNNALQKLY